MFEKINTISEIENMVLGKKIIDGIINISNGDMRKAITMLQELKYL